VIPLSLVSLRLSGGLVLPVLTCAAAGITLSASEGEVAFDWTPSDLVVSFSQPSTRDGPDDALPEVIAAVLAPIGEFLAQLSLPPKVLWGNVASVIVRSAELIAARHPDLGPAAQRHAYSALRGPRLAQAWAGELGPTFRRTSCCQVVDRREQRGRCGDCLFAAGTMASCPAAT
jgi:ferric iron reductase protein FhuF